jgi:cytochrome c oxidase cbb3-type subunit 2
MMTRKRELFVCGTVLAVSLCWAWFNKSDEAATTNDLISQGREIYISEGCIHCHSRYVRPNSGDVEPWGPVVNLENITKEQPVLIGNRRQGPDLLNVGLRRSKSWLKQHFIDPRSLVPKSSMPSYAHLFQDERGDALIAYLSNYEPETIQNRMEMIQNWSPKNQSEPVSLKGGKQLFSQHCAMCHGDEARGDGELRSLWLRPPADLVAGPFLFTSLENNSVSISRVIKFGIPGTDMPGHELLSDPEISDLSAYVKSLRNTLTK